MKTNFQKHNNRGSALVIVLGLLSVLMLSAVAFAISMRTERNAAANYRNATFARHALRAALDHAISDIDEDLGNNPPSWGDNFFVSEYTDDGVTVPAQLVTYETLKYIPGIFRLELRRLYEWQQSSGVFTLPDAPQWVPIEVDPLEDAGAERVRGRYAYAVLDVSDMIDLNYAGGAKRGPGADPKELSLFHLQEVIGSPNLVDSSPADGVHDPCGILEALRTNYAGFETLAEARPLLANSVFQSYFDFQAAGVDDTNSHFVTFSYYPSTNPPPLALESDVVGLKGQRPEITARLAEMLTRMQLQAPGIDNSAYVPDVIFEALIDYVDQDSEPGNLDGDEPLDLEFPCTEAVPMINELVVRNHDPITVTPTGNPDEFTLRMPRFMRVECAYPFTKQWDLGGSPAEVKLQVFHSCEVAGGGVPITGPMAVDPANPFLNWLDGVDYYQREFRFMGPSRDVVVTGTTGSPVKFTLYMRAWVEAGGTWFDVAPAIPGNATKAVPTQAEVEQTFFRFEFAGDLDGSDLELVGGSFEAIDPRFNWAWINRVRNPPTPGIVDQTWLQWQQLAKGQDTMGLVNSWTEKALTPPTAAYGADIDNPTTPSLPRMHVSNLGTLYSPGEMGCLVMGNRMSRVRAGDDEARRRNYITRSALLKTLRLYDHDGSFIRHPVYQHFTMAVAPPTEKGKVNLNSSRGEILAAALAEFPLNFDFAHGSSEANNQYWYFGLEPNEAALANKSVNPFPLLNAVMLRDWPGQGEEKYGDRNYINWRSLYSGDPDMNEIARESIYAATRGLVGARQQLFLVLMRADAFKSRFGITGIKQGKVLATLSGAAMFWRDPLADDDGHHPVYVHFFREASE